MSLLFISRLEVDRRFTRLVSQIRVTVIYVHNLGSHRLSDLSVTRVIGFDRDSNLRNKSRDLTTRPQEWEWKLNVFLLYQGSISLVRRREHQRLLQAADRLHSVPRNRSHVVRKPRHLWLVGCVVAERRFRQILPVLPNSLGMLFINVILKKFYNPRFFL